VLFLRNKTSNVYLDIVIQTGDTYYQEKNSSEFLNTVIGALLGALLSGIFAVWVFKMGSKKEKKRETEKELNRIKRSLSTFHTLLKGTVKTTKQQISDFESYIKIIETNPFSNEVPKQLPHQSLDRIQKLSTAELIELFEHLSFSTDDYLKVVNNLDYLYSVLGQIPKDVESIKGGSIHDLSTKFLEIKSEILTDCADFLIALKNSDPKHEDNDLWKFINQLIIDYYSGAKDGNPDLNYDYNKLVNSLKVTILFKFPLEPISNEILKKTKIASDIIFTIKTFNSSFASELSTIISLIKESIAELETLLTKMKLD